MKPQNVLTPESYEKQQRTLQKDLTNGIYQRTLQLVAFHKDGRKIPLEVQARLICDDNGLPLEIVGIARDVTERQREEEELIESEQLYKSLFRYNPDAVYALDSNGKFTSINDAACQISGYSSDELLNMTFERLVVPANLNKVHQHLDKAKAGYAGHFNASITSKDKHKVNLDITTVPIIVDNKITGVFVIAKTTI